MNFVETCQTSGDVIVFSDIFEAACAEIGVAPTRLLIELGIGKSALSNRKNGSEPSNRTKKQIADHFGVSVSDFMNGEFGIKTPVTSEDDELNEYLDELRNRSEMRMLFKLAKGATKEDVEQAVKIIEALRK